MKKHKIISILALLALPLFSCKADLSSSLTETPSTNTNITSSSGSSDSSSTSSSSSGSASTPSTSQGETHATSLSVALFEKLPKVKDPSSKEEICIFYPASEFTLGAVVIPSEALEQNIIVTIPEEHKAEISYENGKLITKNVYTDSPFDIVISVDGAEASINQKVAVVPGSYYLDAYLGNHFDATDEGEEKCATSASYGMFYGPEKTDGSAPNNSMDIAYCANEITETTFRNGKSVAKTTRRVENGYYYTVNYNEDGTTIDLDTSTKMPIGNNNDQISERRAAFQTNHVSYTNTRYGIASVMSDVLLQYEFMIGGNGYYKETLRFDITEDSDARFSANIVGNKSESNESESKTYAAVKIDILFDSTKRITSFKFQMILAKNEDLSLIEKVPTAENSQTIVFNITYADKKTPNPNPVDFSHVELEKPALEKVKNKFLEIAEQLDEAEGERLSYSQLRISFPNEYEETNEARYYKNETILDSSIVANNDETTSKSQSRTATTIRDNKLYSLSYNSESNKYAVISSSEIGTAEGQTSEADAIYQANHAHFNQNAIGLKGAFETYFMMGLNDGETLGGVTYQNIKTEITSNYDNHFECSIYFSISSSNAGTTETLWGAATASIGFSSGDVNYANLNVDIYTSNPFDSHGNLNQAVTPDRRETVEMTLSYYANNTKIDNPNPITFGESEPESPSPSETSETVAERMSQILTDLNQAEATRAKNARFKMSVTELGEQESQTVCDEELKINYFINETIVSDTSNSYSGNETSTYSEETVTTIRDGYLYKLKYDFDKNTYNLTSKTEIGNDKEAQSEAISEANHAKNPVSGTNLLDDFFEQCFALGLVNQTIPNVGDFQNIQTTILENSVTSLSFTCNYVEIDSSGKTTSEAWFTSTVNLSFEQSKDSEDYLLVGATLERYMFTTNPFDDSGKMLQNVTPNYREDYSLYIEYYENNEKEANPKPIDVTQFAK